MKKVLIILSCSLVAVAKLVVPAKSDLSAEITVTGTIERCVEGNCYVINEKGKKVAYNIGKQPLLEEGCYGKFVLELYPDSITTHMQGTPADIKEIKTLNCETAVQSR